jgi:hypothetical protein
MVMLWVYINPSDADIISAIDYLNQVYNEATGTQVQEIADSLSWH